jgi:hypothetical protein
VVRTTLDGTVAGVRSLVTPTPARRPLAATPGRRTAGRTRKKQRAG